MAQWLPSCSPSPCFGASLMFMICSWGFWHYATSRAWSLFLSLFLFLFLWGPEPALSLFSLLPSPVVMKLRLQWFPSWIPGYLCISVIILSWVLDEAQVFSTSHCIKWNLINNTGTLSSPAFYFVSTIQVNGNQIVSTLVSPTSNSIILLQPHFSSQNYSTKCFQPISSKVQPNSSTISFDTTSS